VETTSWRLVQATRPDDSHDFGRDAGDAAPHAMCKACTLIIVCTRNDLSFRGDAHCSTVKTMRANLAMIAVLTSACVGSIETNGDDRPPSADPQAGCAMSCHGDAASNAPPKSVSGATETTSVAVGAHQAHMNPRPAWHLAVACSDCHVVPAEVGSPGHIDGDNQAEVTFSMRAGVSMWTGTTCTSGCHGSTAWGGAKSIPTWTLVDGSQSMCGSCHGAPPPAPHPGNAANCAECHPTMEDNSLAFRDPDSHINGDGRVHRRVSRFDERGAAERSRRRDDVAEGRRAPGPPQELDVAPRDPVFGLSRRTADLRCARAS
jgi:hypothetical protein